MIRILFVFGSLAGIIIVALSWPLLWSGLIGDQAEAVTLGYLIMVAGLVMTFVGVKRYRDIECGGVIRFRPALALAIGIAAVATLIYVAGAELYFLTPAGASMVAAVNETMLPGYAEPFTRMWITCQEILPVAGAMALLSAAVLVNPRVLPARGASKPPPGVRQP